MTLTSTPAATGSVPIVDGDGKFRRLQVDGFRLTLETNADPGYVRVPSTTGGGDPLIPSP